MVQIRQISNQTTLRELRREFGLKPAESSDVFSEWREPLPALKENEQRALAHIRRNFFTQAEGVQLSENLVKMIVLSPLLDLAGFYGSDFLVRDEVGVEIAVEDQQTLYRGRIDVLVFDERFWVLVLESKHANFSLMKAIPQCLAYLLASPNGDRPIYGMVTNGSNFRFIKLLPTHPPEYDLSDELLLDRGNDFEQVLKILKRLAPLVSS